MQKSLYGHKVRAGLDDLSLTWNRELMLSYYFASSKGEGGVTYLCDLSITNIGSSIEELNARVIGSEKTLQIFSPMSTSDNNEQLSNE
jgi:hypothetical protein